MLHKNGLKGLILLLAAVCLSFHPFYLSVTEINYDAHEKKLQISCKLFIDDIENTLRKTGKTHIDLLNPANKSISEKMLNEYIQKHLTIKTETQNIKYQFLGFEKEEEALWCYFETDELPAPKKLELSNSLLYDFLPEQFNIVHATVSGKRQSMKVNNPESNLSFMF